MKHDLQSSWTLNNERMTVSTKINSTIEIVLKKRIQFNLLHLYVPEQRNGSRMFLIEPSWCMEDIPDSKNHVHNWFCMYYLICLTKYNQYDI